MRHILVAISAHGLGHLAQTAEMLNALNDAESNLRFTIRTALPRHHVEARFTFKASHLPCQEDFGVKTHGGFEVDLEATKSAYDDVHAHWPDVLDAACAQMAEVRPDLILSNVGYVPLAAGARLGIPAYGLASLDWLTILRGFHPTRDAACLPHIEDAYASADGLIEISPSTARAPWRRRLPIGSLAAIGRKRRAELRAQLSVPATTRVLLCAFGGGLPPRAETDVLACPDTLFLAPRAWADHPSVIPLDTVDWPFMDLLASSDACLAKLGGGIAAEAVRNGVPLLYHRRTDWAEDDALAAWLTRFTRAEEINLSHLTASDLSQALLRVTSQRPPSIPAFEGPARFIRHMQSILRGTTGEGELSGLG